jgi:UDP-N-acetylglucosamine 4,6-dehydratase/5-epimerase
VVVHAAALKQIPSCEYNPFETIKTNILGAQNVVEAALDLGVRKVLALSTDKAAEPVNLYGATKLCMERMLVQSNSYAGDRPTRFSCARYGNVVGSRGSVVPLFLAQRASGRVTVTDRRMTRFWLTLTRATDFVLDCLGSMKGGEIFVPKCPSMSILDLAAAIAPGCEVEVVGIRPGEKLHEMLLSEHEARHAVEREDVYVVLPEHRRWRQDEPITGEPLPEGFSYTSDRNDAWLGAEEARRMVADALEGD